MAGVDFVEFLSCQYGLSESGIEDMGDSAKEEKVCISKSKKWCLKHTKTIGMKSSRAEDKVRSPVTNQGKSRVKLLHLGTAQWQQTTASRLAPGYNPCVMAYLDSPFKAKKEFGEERRHK